MNPFEILLTTALATGTGADAPLAVPSGAQVWLQEVLTDNVVGMGLVARFRFVMPSLADQVPPAESYTDDYADVPLSDDDVEALNDGSISGTPVDEEAAEDGGAPVFEVLPPETPALDLTPGLGAPASPVDEIEAGAGEMIPEEAFDLPVAPSQPGTEAAADAELPLPAAPDVLMQDPNHLDVVWLCENVALPRLKELPKRPQQVVISLGSAESEFGTFDPGVVQLFEGFRIPPDRDACIWEPW